MPNYKTVQKDNNHNEIADTARGAGYRWEDTYQLGNGFPDGLAFSKSTPPRAVLIEVKNLNGRGVRFTPAELEFQRRLPECAPYHVVVSGEEFLEVMRRYDAD